MTQYKGYPYTIVFTDPSLPGKDRFVITQNTSDGPLLPTLDTPDSSATQIHTSLVLPGMGLAQYGERVNQDLVQLLENFAGRTPPVHPTIGQSWYDWNTKEMKVWNGTLWALNSDGVVAGVPEYNILATWLNDVTSQPAVPTPYTIYPPNGAINVVPDVIFKGSPFASRYNTPQGAVQFQASKTSNFATIAYEVTRAGAFDTAQFGQWMTASTVFYWRLRYQDTQGSWSDWSNTASLTVEKASINTPSIISPVSNNTPLAAILVGSPISIKNGTDTLTQADWEIWSGPNGTGTLYLSATSGTTSYQVAAGVLTNFTNYYVRVRYHGATLGVSEWSSSAAFKTIAIPAGTVLSHFCAGYNYMAVTADGNGGTYDALVEVNSGTHCGYVPPIPAGTVLSHYCSGYNYMAVVADGNYGTYEVLQETNSVTYCGFVVPISTVEYSAPGTYTVTVPANVYKANVYLQAGGGGGGGGGGAGEYNWTPSASGGGGGGGGAGEMIDTVIDVIPGQILTITIGPKGLGGMPGNGYWYPVIGAGNARRIGLKGGDGLPGSSITISPMQVVARGGEGGQGGAGGDADNPWFSAAGGNSGGGWPGGEPGQYNHVNSGFFTGNSAGRLGDACNFAAGLGGANGVGVNIGGKGGTGGIWGTPGWERYSTTYPGLYGWDGDFAYARITFGKSTPSGVVGKSYTPGKAPVAWPPYVPGGGGGGGGGGGPGNETANEQM